MTPKAITKALPIKQSRQSTIWNRVTRRSISFFFFFRSMSKDHFVLMVKNDPSFFDTLAYKGVASAKTYRIRKISLVVIQKVRKLIRSLVKSYFPKMNSPTGNLCHREQYSTGSPGWRIGRKMILSTGTLIESDISQSWLTRTMFYPHILTSFLYNILLFLYLYGKVKMYCTLKEILNL